MSQPTGPPDYLLGFKTQFDEEEEKKSKFFEKAKDNPMVPIGITGGLSALAYSIYKFKTRKEKLSVYLIHTRLAAQGAVVGCLTLGVMYKLYTDFIAPKKQSKD